VNALGKIRAYRPLAQNPSRLAGCETSRLLLTSRPQRDEERLTEYAGMPPQVEPGLEDDPRLFGNRNDSFLSPLPHHPNFPGRELEIPHIEGHQLADPDAGSVEQFDERPITQPHPASSPGARAIGVGGRSGKLTITGHQLFAIVDREGMGQTLLLFGHRHTSSGIVAHIPLPQHPAIKGTHARKFSTQRRRTAPFVKTREPGPNMLGVDPVGSDLGTRVYGQLTHIG
jgi:hypothetical protein